MADKQTQVRVRITRDEALKRLLQGGWYIRAHNRETLTLTKDCSGFMRGPQPR